MTQTHRLFKQLTIDGKPVVNIVKDVVHLDLFSTGRATFVVVSDEEPKGIVELHCGYRLDSLIPYFLGVIESKHFSNGQWFLTCRELIGALSFNIPIAIRYATLHDVLKKIETVGVKFVYPDSDYINSPVACFYHSGDGISALRQLGKIYQISDYIFQQRPDGKIYVGSWHDSGWATSPVDNFTEHVLNVSSTTKGSLVAIPKLRPGVKINNRFVVETTMTGNKQDITWSRTLSAA